MGKQEIRPLATPKPINRSSQKVIMSWISIDAQNLVAIPQGVSFPRMHEIAHQNVYSASFWGSSNGLQPRPLNRLYAKQRGSAQGCAFSGLENKNLTFTPRNSQKTAIFGLDFDGTKNFDRKLLYNGVLPCKLPLIVVVAL